MVAVEHDGDWRRRAKWVDRPLLIRAVAHLWAASELHEQTLLNGRERSATDRSTQPRGALVSLSYLGLRRQCAPRQRSQASRAVESDPIRALPRCVPGDPRDPPRNLADRCVRALHAFDEATRVASATIDARAPDRGTLALRQGSRATRAGLRMLQGHMDIER